MKVITVSYDGHVNSTGFRSWAEARDFVVSRIPEKSQILISKDMFFSGKLDEYWTTLEYAEVRGKRLLHHIWELNEVELTKLGSS